MLTTEKLREYGADVDEALVRCMNKENFYLMLVGKAVNDKRLTQLEAQIAEKDLDAKRIWMLPLKQLMHSRACMLIFH